MTHYVLVHGGFIGGWYWTDVAELLERKGHRVEVVEQLPSIGTDPTALGDLQADAAVVRQTIDTVGDQVVLVGHSYAGMVITELADHPAVAHSVYLSALWPQRGQSAMDLLSAAGPPPDWVVLRDNGTVEASDDQAASDPSGTFISSPVHVGPVSIWPRVWPQRMRGFICDCYL